jgi:hypothetical protein
MSDPTIFSNGTMSYRYKRSSVWVFLAMALFYMIVAIWFSVTTYLDTDGSFSRSRFSPQAWAIFYALFWGGWMLLSILMALAYAKGSLNLANDHVQEAFCFFARKPTGMMSQRSNGD